MAKDAEGGERTGCMTLPQIAETLAAFELKYPKPLDTHIFASAYGRDVLRQLFPAPKRLSSDVDIAPAQLRRFMGMEIWDDLTVPDTEVQLGCVEWKDGQPRKVVTKIFNLKHGAAHV